MQNLQGHYTDLTVLFKITDGKTELIIAMIEAFITEIEEYKASIFIALDKSDWDQISYASHKFMSSFYVFGTTAIIEKFELIKYHSKETRELVKVKLIVEEIVLFAQNCIHELQEIIRKISNNIL